MGSGLVGIDVDAHRGGEETLEALIRGRFPRSPIVATGGGGLHFLFTGSVDREGRDALGVGVDVKAEGGYLVAPPWLHHSGNRYAWLVWDEEPTSAARLPSSAPTPAPHANAATEPGESRGEPDALRRRRAPQRGRVRSLPEGRSGSPRRAVLCGAGAVSVRGSGELPELDVVSVLTNAGVESGLPSDVAEAHVVNGIQQGVRNGVR
jgi:hypothetical protein